MEIYFILFFVSNNMYGNWGASSSLSMDSINLNFGGKCIWLDLRKMGIKIMTIAQQIFNSVPFAANHWGKIQDMARALALDSQKSVVKGTPETCYNFADGSLIWIDNHCRCGWED